jgi:menaquinone-dependent protoporphyrinogen IX oxidase
MKDKTLIVYASRLGSKAEVARAVLFVIKKRRWFAVITSQRRL